MCKGDSFFIIAIYTCIIRPSLFHRVSHCYERCLIDLIIIKFNDTCYSTHIYYYLIRPPLAATLNLPALVEQASPACHHNVRRGRLTYHRGRGGVMVLCTHPIFLSLLRFNFFLILLWLKPFQTFNFVKHLIHADNPFEIINNCDCCMDGISCPELRIFVHKSRCVKYNVGIYHKGIRKQL